MVGVKSYEQALKLGMKAYRDALAKGMYPYLPALDDILSCIEVQYEEELGLIEIPMDQIVGTKTSGRQNAFAGNFMPLMPEGSEFAYKWARVYEYQTEEGNTDPIVVYEFINKFYVQEGNKRVSVCKYLDAPTMEAKVIRIIPKKNESLENTALYQWMSRHCQEYGFIVRYPKDKEEITGIIYEPWHFRYVGVEAATYMVEHNLCLEEFVALYQ